MIEVRLGRVAAVMATVTALCLLSAGGVLAADSAARRSGRSASSASFTGSASDLSSGRVVVQRLSGARWVVVARGSLGKHGRFALTWAAPSQAGRAGSRGRKPLAIGRFAVAYDGLQAYLERCGSTLRMALPSFPLGNASGLLFTDGGRDLTGVFLASLRRFVAWIPATAGSSSPAPAPYRTDYGFSVTLSATTRYDENDAGALWAGPAPSER